MAAGISLFGSKNMSSPFSGDDSYSTPVRVGSLRYPLNSVSGSTSVSIPIWLRNTGGSKMCNIHIRASDGSVDAMGGVADSSTPGFIELAKDDCSRLPDSQRSAPSSFASAPSHSPSARLYVDNVSTSLNAKKTISHIGSDSDARTMLPGEYAIVWVRCSVDAARSEGGSLPTPAGIRNIKFDICGTDYSSHVGGEVSMMSRMLVMVRMVVDIEGSVYIETLAAQWRFDEGSGSWAYDSKSINHGLIEGCRWWAIGINGKSLYYEPGSKVLCGNRDNLNMGTHHFALEAWFKMPDFTHGSIISKTDGTHGCCKHVYAGTPACQQYLE